MQLLALLQWPVSPSHMCDMLNLRTFIDLQMQSSTRPAPPQTALQIKRKASPFKLCFPFMYAVRALFVRVRLRYGGLSRFLFFFFHFCCILSGWGWLHSCMHELSSRYNWWDLSLFFLSLCNSPTTLLPDQQQLMKVDWFSCTSCIQCLIWRMKSTRKTKDPTAFCYIMSLIACQVP